MSQIEKTVLAIDDYNKRKSFKTPEIDFVKYLHEVEKERSNVKDVTEFHDEMITLMGGAEDQGATMPWTKTHENIRFRKGEVTMWQGFNGHKKSMVLGYLSLGFILQNQAVCIASLEMKPVSTLRRMLRQAAGCSSPTEVAWESFKNFAGGKLYLYDKQGTLNPETLYGLMHYASRELNIKHFVVDSLMRVIPGEDKYNEQKDFVVRLCDIAQETGLHIHLVHHNRKGDESKPAGRYGAKGSGSLSDNVHNALEVHQPPEHILKNMECTATNYIYCDKQREGEWTGGIALWFDPESLQFMGSEKSGVRTWLK